MGEFIRRKIVSFTLASEYKNSHAITERLKQGIVERKILSRHTRELRNLRRQFYNHLNKIAFQSPIGWIVFDEDEEELNKLEKIVEKMRRLSTDFRSSKLELIEVQVPKESYVEWLERYKRELIFEIEMLRARMTHYETNERRRRIDRRIQELRRLLSKINGEMSLVENSP